MKKIIFLMCACVFMAQPVLCAESDLVKEEVKRVKLEAKQRVEKIKADAKAAKLKAKEDAKQAKIDAKNAEINAIAEAKKAKKEAEFNSKISDIKAANDTKVAELNAAAKAKKDKIDADLNAKISKINEQNDLKIAALRAKYEGKKPVQSEKAEKTVKAKETETKVSNKAEKAEKRGEEQELKPAVNLKSAAQNSTDADVKPQKSFELKPRAVEKKPAAYSGINFETKRTEIMEELNLTEKQRVSAEKLYDKNKEEIALVNIEMENTQKELKMLKKVSGGDESDVRARTRRISSLEEKMNSLLQERDSVHNDAMKKFDNILDKEQREIWLDIKNKGARLFPDIEAIR